MDHMLIEECCELIGSGKHCGKEFVIVVVGLDQKKKLTLGAVIAHGSYTMGCG